MSLEKRLRKRFRLGYAFFNKRCCVPLIGAQDDRYDNKKECPAMLHSGSTISIHPLQMRCAPRWDFHEIAGPSRHQFREPSTHFLAVSFTMASRWT